MWVRDYNSGAEQPIATNRLVRAWLREDLEEASSFVVENTQSEGYNHSLSEVAEAWIQRDPAQGREWISARNEGGTSDPAFVHGAVSLAGEGKYTDAVEWLGEIQTRDRQIAAAGILGNIESRRASRMNTEPGAIEPILRQRGLDQGVIDAYLEGRRGEGPRLEEGVQIQP